MDIETDVRWLVQQALTSRRHDNQVTSQLCRDILPHAHAANSLTQHAIDRKSTLSEVKALLRNLQTLDTGPNSGHAALVLHGEVGAGKTTLMAQLHRALPLWFGPSCVRVTRFCGFTSHACSVHELLLSVCGQVGAAYGVALPRGLGQRPVARLAATLAKLLRRVSDVSAQRPLYILLDSLDSLSPALHNPSWIPHPCPPHVYLVVSLRERQQQNPALYTRACALLKSRDTFIKVSHLSSVSATKLIDNYLSSHERTLTQDQHQTLLAMSQQASYSPLYMTLILAQAKTWDSLFKPSELQLGKTVTLALEHIFEQLGEKHGQKFVRYSLGYLTVSRGKLK